MPDIHPKTLRALREKAGFQQKDLADAAGLSAKQISRLESLEKGDQLNRCNAGTLKKLVKALNLKDEGELARPPQDTEPESLGLKRAYVLLSERDRTHYRFLEARYGVQAGAILRAAPILFAALAEISLAERKRKLEALEVALSSAEYDAVPHLADILTGLARAEAGIYLERASIEACDISGSTIPDEEWSEHYSGSGDLFLDFIASTLRALAPNILGPEDELVSGPMMNGISADLFGPELKRLSGGDGLARLAIERGDVGPKDIPDDLLSEDNRAARIAWLHGRCSDETRRTHAELKKISDSLVCE